jgi:hypothetical protein
MTVEEMEAHAAYMDAFLRKSRQDWIAELTEELAAEKNPYAREWLTEAIEKEKKALATGKYE